MSSEHQAKTGVNWPIFNLCNQITNIIVSLTQMHESPALSFIMNLVSVIYNIPSLVPAFSISWCQVRGNTIQSV